MQLRTDCDNPVAGERLCQLRGWEFKSLRGHKLASR